MTRFDRPRVPMADRVLTEPIKGLPEDAVMLKRLLYVENAHRVLADDVAEWVFTFCDDPYDVLDLVPTLAPPFVRLWVEFAVPQAPKGSGFRAGLGCWWSERGDTSETADMWDGAQAREMIARFPDPRWLLAVMLLVEVRGTIKPALLYHIALDDDGKLMWDGDTPSMQYQLHPFSADMGEDVRDGLFGYCLAPGLLSIGFMHCSNVVHDIAVPVGERVAREFARAHGRPLLTYKTIRVVPFQPVKVPLASPTGEPRPWHKVRGHFADYRRVGLFGKHRGIFWVPEHGRGNPKVGTVEHTYEVTEPYKATVERG